MPRISEAVLSHGKGLLDLSATTGISVERLREIIEGADPSMGEVRALSAGLKVSLADLAPPPREFQQADLLFRGIAKKKHLPQGTVAETLSRKMGYSLELLRNTDRSVQRWTTDFADLPKDNPEAFAFHFRQLFCAGDQVSPLLSLPQLLADRLRIMVFVVSTRHFDGASAYLGGVPFIFVAASFPARMLFTCAHELGHLLAHHDASKDFAVIDAGSDFVLRRSATMSERFAHTFASALLIPRAGLGIVLKKVREAAKVPLESPIGDLELMYASRIFGVSFEVVARRCEDLDLIPRGAAVSINEKIKNEYGSAEKRADALGLPARASISFPALPRPLLTSVIEKIRSGDLSIGRASMMLGLSIADLLASNAPQVQ